MRVFLVIAVLLLAGSVQAATLTVCPSGCEYSSIQPAIDAASPGNVVEVHSGNYNEQVVMNKDTFLKGTDTGSGQPSISIMHLCGHPESSASGFTFGILNTGYPNSNQFKMSEQAKSTITVATSPEYEKSAALLYSDDFSNINSGWPTRSSNPKDFSVGYSGGKYFINGIKLNQAVKAWLPKKTFSNFAIEVEAALEKGPNDCGYGIILRQSNDGYYRFKISGTGKYCFDKFQNGKWTNLIPWTISSAINVGKATNIIKAECDGDNFTFYLNSVKLDSYNDDSFGSGNIGLGIEVYRVGGVQVSFDNLRMWAVSKSEMTAANDLNNTSPTQAMTAPLAQAQTVTNNTPKVTQGSTLTVCPGGCEYSSIQAAVDAASPGDIVKVQSGTYEGDVNIVEDNITLRGVDTGGGCPNLDGGVTSYSAPIGCWGTLNGPWNIQSAV